MKIALTGAQGTGKTTLLDRLKHDDEFRYDYEFIDEITRRMLKKGLKINEQGTDTTQILILNEHIKNLLMDNFISDRSIIDGAVYTTYLYMKRQVSKEVFEFADFLFEKYIGEYDYIFYLQPEFELEDDGVRSANVEFRNDIVNIFEEFIDFVAPEKLIFLSGTVEERLNKFKKIVNG